MIKQIHPAPSKFDDSANKMKNTFDNFQYPIEPKEKQTIEIITVPNSRGQKNQKNVAITFNTKLIRNILSKVYSRVRISEITTPRFVQSGNQTVI